MIRSVFVSDTVVACVGVVSHVTLLLLDEDRRNVRSLNRRVFAPFVRRVRLRKALNLAGVWIR